MLPGEYCLYGPPLLAGFQRSIVPAIEHVLIAVLVRRINQRLGDKLMKAAVGEYIYDASICLAAGVVKYVFGPLI